MKILQCITLYNMKSYLADIAMEYTNKELVAFWAILSLTLRGQHIP